MALEEDRSPEAPLWYVTYGDMMTLLLTFFIMIMSFSEVREQEKYQAVATSMHRQFGHDEDRGVRMSGWTRPRNAKIANLVTLARTQKHELIGAKENDLTLEGEGFSPNILRTKEFLVQELGIPAERIRISFGTGDEEKVEIFLKKRTTDEELLGREVNETSTKY
jgi:flagellar motor protein MotB